MHTSLDWEPPEEIDEPDELLELARCIEPLVATLPEAYADAIRRTDLGDNSQLELARELGMSPSGVRTRVQRARGLLKDALLECCPVPEEHGGFGCAAPESAC